MTPLQPQRENNISSSDIDFDQFDELTSKWLSQILLENIEMKRHIASRPIPQPPAPEQCPHWKDSYNLKSDCRDQGIGKFYCAKPSAEHDATIRNATLDEVLPLAQDMYGVMMCVKQENTVEFMDYFVKRMEGFALKYNSLRTSTPGAKGDEQE